MKSKKISFFKYSLVFVMFLLIVGLIIYLFPVLQKINTPEGQLAFRDKINSFGPLGFLWLLGIQIAQIFLIVIPGEPIEVLAGMCYGAWWGTVFILLSSEMISFVIFLLVRKFGKKFIYQFCQKEKIDKMQKSRLFQNPKRIEKILALLFFIPGTPKDLLAYLSGLLPVKPFRYAIISTLARIPSVISSTLVGENIAFGNWQNIFVVYGITFLLVGMILLLFNKLDKSKVTKETLNTLKEEKF